MELRNLTICLSLLVLAVSQCSGIYAGTENTSDLKYARHSIHRRASDDTNYGDPQADEALEDEAQNDAEGGDDEEAVNGTILTTPENYHVSIGKNVQLECQVSPKEGPVVQWLKDGEQYFFGTNKLKGSSRLSLVPGSSDLLIKDIQPSDSGIYKCELIQETPVAIQHTVVVSEAPRITRFTASKQGLLTEGDDLLLTCDATGSPKPEIIWSREIKNGGTSKLTEKDGQFSSNSFFAKNVGREMTGKYYCYAINTVNSSQAALFINVAGKPRVHVHKTIVNSAIGVEAVLQCAAHEEPAPYIRWYKDGLQIAESTTQYVISTQGSYSNLTVTPSSDGDFGTFTCEAENHHGTHNRSIELVESPVVEDLGYEDMKLTWRVHSHQPLEDMEVQLRSMDNDGEWKTMKVPLPNSDEKKHEYEVIYLLADKELQSGKYEATVKVKNEKSWSKHSDPAIIQIENQAQPIQTASVFRSNDAPSIRPTTAAILSTSFMYLLVRMF